MEASLLVSCFLAGITLAAWLWSRRASYSLACKLPGYRWALPFLGHTYLFFGYGVESIFARIRSALEEDFKLPYFKLWLGPQLTTVVTDARCVQKIVYNPALLHKGDLLHAADPIVGNGMLFGSGPDVKRRRKGFQTSLKMKMLEQYLPLFHRHSSILLEVLEQMITDGEEFDLEEHLHHCSFDAVNETTICVRSNTLLGENHELVKAFIEVYGLLYQDIAKPWLYYGKMALRSLGVKFRADVICDMLDAHIGKALQRKKSELQTEYNINNVNTNEKLQHGNNANDKSTPGKHRDGDETIDDKQNGAPKKEEIISTLEFMLRSNFSISDDDLVMELKNVFLAASDTVATICSFLFKMFAVHPKYQERAYIEVLDVLGDNPGVPTLSQLARLEFLDRCLKETLRLFPIAPLIPRKCDEPLQLDDKLTLPPGTTILIGAFWLHRSPEYWQRPEQFYPAHFTAELQASRHQGAYVPFSGGPHSCIGQQYARILMKIVSAMILSKYRLEPTDTDFMKCHLEHSSAKHQQHGASSQNGEHIKCRLNSSEIQNGGDAENGIPCTVISKDANEFKSNGFANNFENAPCTREGCTGRFIPEDYVAKMYLGIDISVRLVGGVKVKMFNRKN